MLHPLQIDLAGTKLLDYGVLGLVLFFVGYFAYKLYMQQQEYTKEWKSEAKEARMEVFELTSKQNSISEAQVEIQKAQALQTKEFYDNMIRKIDEVPRRTVKEIDYSRLQHQQNTPNTTPAP